MSFNTPPKDDASVETGTPHLSSEGHAQPLSPSFKASSLSGNAPTPRLLFTWDPYGNIASTVSPSLVQTAPGGPPVSRLPEPEQNDEGRPPSSGEECSTPSSTNNNTGNHNCGGDTGSTFSAGATAQPPLTITSLLSCMNGGSTSAAAGSVRSPPLSSNTVLHTPHHQPSGETASAHSTPSGPVLKRISTSAKDGRQYFLDYSPVTAANANPAGVAGGMPNLILPPNLSPHSRVVSPLNAALPQTHSPAQSYQNPNLSSQKQQVAEMELLEADNRESDTASPQAVPLVSPPRSSSIGGAVGPGPYTFHAPLNHATSGYGTYGTSSQQQQSSSLLGISMNSGMLSASIGSLGGGASSHMQHNPYRTSPTLYPAPANVAASSAAGPPLLNVTAPVAVQRVQTVDTDADLYEVLETTPSLFIKRLLPPPPPLADVARVLPARGVVQTLCGRWCSLVEAVLRSREFGDVNTPPPPPPPSIPPSTVTSPIETDSAVAVSAGNEEDSSKRATGASSIQEELRAWSKAAVEWYEQLDQAGATTVDIRVSSRTVAWAIEAAASGRGRRGGQQGNNHNSSRFHGQSADVRGAGSPSYRGGAHGGYQGNTPYNGRGTGYAGGAMSVGYRGGRGAGSSFYAAGGMTNNSSIRNATNEMETTAGSSGTTRHLYPAPTSNFNPYAKSWTFSGDTQVSSTPGDALPPLLSASSKPSYMSKTPTAGQQGYIADPSLGQM
ncbi:hypothetical protein ABL78_2516 [Leptomonas seymouri]|uniref:Uncharacterized protein n=1 Tax=Leptomonas seymouri TaxID=5684 RepID=A0A0N0P7J0_LEPSE|nr:hypothetical protein ABL78_2516 [Leptomonas seymouri]|eukprot:KPI88397.1 hypothetical protein ABL78_2516 [Leptomonas seymouri]